MFHEYFGIAEDPFSITPDTRYLYLSERHRNAFAHLIYGVAEGGGFVQLTGEVGTGKTLLCRNLLAQLPQEVNVALIFNPRLTPLELVASICDELKILYPLGCDSIKEVVDFLNAYLLESHAQGRRTVVIIDEAQNLSFEALEQVRLLTNLETEQQKLLQIILVGQPELKTVLEKPQLRQLAQRVTARYHLTPLSSDETRGYVQHRLNVAGVQTDIFHPTAIRKLYKLSGGVPRLINVLCSRAMMAAYAADTKEITGHLLSKVAAELKGEDVRESKRVPWGWVAAGVAVVVLGGMLLLQDQNTKQWTGEMTPPAVSAETAAPAVEVAEAAAEKLVVNSEPGVQVDPQASIPADTAGEATEPPAEDVVQTRPISAEITSTVEVDPLESNSSLDLMGVLGNQNSAFATLFAYWQAVYPKDDDALSACERADRVGLSCIYGRGDWRSLEYYNRPAVIELLLDDGHRYHVVVSELDNGRVTLDLESRRLTFSRDEIESLWTGSYIVLWRPPELSRDVMSLGDQGRSVAWLISMLDRIEGVQTEYDSDAAKFDRALKKRVMRFQNAKNLIADGVVGEKTIIMLSVAVKDATVPVLSRREG
jgi:general secretion pathway protein A